VLDYKIKSGLQVGDI